MKMLYISGGVLFFLLGVIGLVIPVVPQVPFFLLSVYLFSKGSPKFEKKLKSTKIYQKYVPKITEELTFHKYIKYMLIFLIIAVILGAVGITVIYLNDGFKSLFF